MSIDHASFTIIRDYKAKPARVFAAHAREDAKRAWFVDAEGWETAEYSLDFRPHGWEIWRGRFQGGPEIRNNTLYLDIVENTRIILAYEMFAGDARLSASLLTITFAAHGGGTRLTLTEQGAYLDGGDGARNREIGTRDLLEALAKAVDG